MVTPGTQKRQRKANKKAKEAASSRVEKEVSALKGKKNQHVHITAEQILHERDTRELSWAQVATNLGLGSPGAARSAYTKLTGIPHTESQMSGTRARKGAGSTIGRKTHDLEWSEEGLDEFDLDKLQTTILETLPGRTVRIARTTSPGCYLEEFIKVRKVHRFTFDGKDESGPLVAHVTDDQTGASRTFRTRDIKEAL